MAAAVTITTFSGLAPPWSLTQLDTNLTNLQAAIQSQNTFSNYLVDSGAANAYVTTPAAGLTATLTAGLLLQFKAANANTAASTLNHAALGAKNILNIDGTALSAGQIPANSVVQVVYDGTQFLLMNAVPAYATGTWVPSVGGTATYGVQIGTWVKIGRVVYIFCQMNITLIGSGSTTAISGLPFTPTGDNFAMTVRVSAASATNIVSAVGFINSAAINILSRTAASAGDAANAIFQNGTGIYVTGFYFVAA